MYILVFVAIVGRTTEQSQMLSEMDERQFYKRHPQPPWPGNDASEIDETNYLANSVVSVSDFSRKTPAVAIGLRGVYNYDSTSIRRPFDDCSTAYEKVIKVITGR